MTRTKQPFRDFDLPVKHLHEGQHWVPPKARDPAEIARRRLLPRGGLMAEFQRTGISITAHVLDFAARENVVDKFLVNTVAAFKFNTSWYLHAASAEDVMRRRLKMPENDKNLDDLEPGKMLAAVRNDLYASDHDAKMLTRYPYIPKFSKNLGIRVGNASLHLASVSVLPELEAAGRDTFLVQEITRHAALAMIETSRHMHEEVHANPSIAQLADPDSPLSHYWRVNGSDFAVEALRHAVEMPMAA